MPGEILKGRNVFWNMFEDPPKEGDTHFTFTLGSFGGSA